MIKGGTTNYLRPITVPSFSTAPGMACQRQCRVRRRVCGRRRMASGRTCTFTAPVVRPCPTSSPRPTPRREVVRPWHSTREHWLVNATPSWHSWFYSSWWWRWTILYVAHFLRRVPKLNFTFLIARGEYWVWERLVWCWSGLPLAWW